MRRLTGTLPLRTGLPPAGVVAQARWAGASTSSTGPTAATETAPPAAATTEETRQKGRFTNRRRSPKRVVLRESEQSAPSSAAHIGQEDATRQAREGEAHTHIPPLLPNPYDEGMDFVQREGAEGRATRGSAASPAVSDERGKRASPRAHPQQHLRRPTTSFTPRTTEVVSVVAAPDIDTCSSASAVSYLLTLRRAYGASVAKKLADGPILLQSARRFLAALARALADDGPTGKRPASPRVTWTEALAKEIIRTYAVFGFRVLADSAAAQAAHFLIAHHHHHHRPAGEEKRAKHREAVSIDGLVDMAKLSIAVLRVLRSSAAQMAFARNEILPAAAAAATPTLATTEVADVVRSTYSSSSSGGEALGGKEKMETARAMLAGLHADSRSLEQYLTSCLLPSLVEGFRVLCVGTPGDNGGGGEQREAAPPFTLQEREAFSTALSAFGKCLGAKLVHTVTDEGGRRRIWFDGPVNRSFAEAVGVEVAATVPREGSVPAIHTMAFATGLSRFTRGLAQDPRGSAAVAEMLRRESSHQRRRTTICITPRGRYTSHPANRQAMSRVGGGDEDDASGGGGGARTAAAATYARTERSMNFNVDVLYPVVQFYTHGASFQLFAQEDSSMAGDTASASAAVTEETARMLADLLFHLVHWAHVSRSYQIAFAASLYARALCWVPPTASASSFQFRVLRLAQAHLYTGSVQEAHWGGGVSSSLPPSAARRFARRQSPAKEEKGEATDDEAGAMGDTRPGHQHHRHHYYLPLSVTDAFVGLSEAALKYEALFNFSDLASLLPALARISETIRRNDSEEGGRASSLSGSVYLATPAQFSTVELTREWVTRRFTAALQRQMRRRAVRAMRYSLVIPTPASDQAAAAAASTAQHGTGKAEEPLTDRVVDFREIDDVEDEKDVPPPPVSAAAAASEQQEQQQLTSGMPWTHKLSLRAPAFLLKHLEMNASDRTATPAELCSILDGLDRLSVVGYSPTAAFQCVSEFFAAPYTLAFTSANEFYTLANFALRALPLTYASLPGLLTSSAPVPVPAAAEGDDDAAAARGAEEDAEGRGCGRERARIVSLVVHRLMSNGCRPHPPTRVPLANVSAAEVDACLSLLRQGEGEGGERGGTGTPPPPRSSPDGADGHSHHHHDHHDHDHGVPPPHDALPWPPPHGRAGSFTTAQSLSLLTEVLCRAAPTDFRQHGMGPASHSHWRCVLFHTVATRALAEPDIVALLRTPGQATTSLSLPVEAQQHQQQQRRLLEVLLPLLASARVMLLLSWKEERNGTSGGEAKSCNETLSLYADALAQRVRAAALPAMAEEGPCSDWRRWSGGDTHPTAGVASALALPKDKRQEEEETAAAPHLGLRSDRHQLNMVTLLFLCDQAFRQAALAGGGGGGDGDTCERGEGPAMDACTEAAVSALVAKLLHKPTGELSKVLGELASGSRLAADGSRTLVLGTPMPVLMGVLPAERLPLLSSQPPPPPLPFAAWQLLPFLCRLDTPEPAVAAFLTALLDSTQIALSPSPHHRHHHADHPVQPRFSLILAIASEVARADLSLLGRHHVSHSTAPTGAQDAFSFTASPEEAMAGEELRATRAVSRLQSFILEVAAEELARDVEDVSRMAASAIPTTQEAAQLLCLLLRAHRQAQHAHVPSQDSMPCEKHETVLSSLVDRIRGRYDMRRREHQHMLLLQQQQQQQQAARYDEDGDVIFDVSPAPRRGRHGEGPRPGGQGSSGGRDDDVSLSTNASSVSLGSARDLLQQVALMATEGGGRDGDGGSALLLRSSLLRMIVPMVMAAINAAGHDRLRALHTMTSTKTQRVAEERSRQVIDGFTACVGLLAEVAPEQVLAAVLAFYPPPERAQEDGVPTGRWRGPRPARQPTRRGEGSLRHRGGKRGGEAAAASVNGILHAVLILAKLKANPNSGTAASLAKATAHHEGEEEEEEGRDMPPTTAARADSGGGGGGGVRRVLRTVVRQLFDELIRAPRSVVLELDVGLLCRVAELSEVQANTPVLNHLLAALRGILAHQLHPSGRSRMSFTVTPHWLRATRRYQRESGLAGSSPLFPHAMKGAETQQQRFDEDDAMSVVRQMFPVPPSISVAGWPERGEGQEEEGSGSIVLVDPHLPEAWRQLSLDGWHLLLSHGLSISGHRSYAKRRAFAARREEKMAQRQQKRDRQQRRGVGISEELATPSSRQEERGDGGFVDGEEDTACFLSSPQDKLFGLLRSCVWSVEFTFTGLGLLAKLPPPLVRELAGSLGAVEFLSLTCELLRVCSGHTTAADRAWLSAIAASRRNGGGGESAGQGDGAQPGRSATPPYMLGVPPRFYVSEAGPLWEKANPISVLAEQDEQRAGSNPCCGGGGGGGQALLLRTPWLRPWLTAAFDVCLGLAADYPTFLATIRSGCAERAAPEVLDGGESQPPTRGQIGNPSAEGGLVLDLQPVVEYLRFLEAQQPFLTEQRIARELEIVDSSEGGEERSPPPRGNGSDTPPPPPPLSYTPLLLSILGNIQRNWSLCAAEDSAAPPTTTPATTTSMESRQGHGPVQVKHLSAVLEDAHTGSGAIRADDRGWGPHVGVGLAEAAAEGSSRSLFAFRREVLDLSVWAARFLARDRQSILQSVLNLLFERDDGGEGKRGRATGVEARTEVRRRLLNLKPRDLALLLRAVVNELHTTTTTTPTTTESNEGGQEAVSFLLQSIDEVVELAGGSEVLGIAQTLTPLLRRLEEVKTQTKLARQLRRTLSAIPPLAAHDVERFSKREALDLFLCLHEQSLVSQSAARAVRLALTPEAWQDEQVAFHESVRAVVASGDAGARTALWQELSSANGPRTTTGSVMGETLCWKQLIKTVTFIEVAGL